MSEWHVKERLVRLPKRILARFGPTHRCARLEARGSQGNIVYIQHLQTNFWTNAFGIALSLPPWFDQVHLNIRCQRLELRLIRQLHSNDRLAGTCLSGELNWAVVEHASAALLERTCCAALLALLVGVNQRRLDGFASGENVFAEGAKAARVPADLAEEYLEVVYAAKAQPVPIPALQFFRLES